MILQGPLLDEVHQQINPWIYQVISFLSKISFLPIYYQDVIAWDSSHLHMIVTGSAGYQSLQGEGAYRSRVYS